MNDAPYTGDLNVGAASTRDDLAGLLRTVHIKADKPSLRTLESRTRHSPSPLSKTAVAEMLKGSRFPRKAVMVAFLRACGIKDDDMGLWLRAWERIALNEGAPLRPGAAHLAADRREDPLDIKKPPSLTLGDVGAPAPSGILATDHSVGGENDLDHLATLRHLRQQINRLSNENEALRADLATTEHHPEKESNLPDATSDPRAQSPVVCRRELGTLLHNLRTSRGMTVDQVADHLMCSRNKVRQMETGFRAGTVRDVRDLCDLFGVTEDDERDHLMDLARIAKQRGRWHSYGLQFSTYAGLEVAASSIEEYVSAVVPGLLQTADYARAILSCWDSVLRPEVIEQRVGDRLNRQLRLREADPPNTWFILGEEALHRLVGGPVVMIAQLNRLIEIAELPNVTIQVVPYEIGAHTAVGGSFIILKLAAPIDSVVYVEGLFGDLLLERPQDVENYKLTFARLQEVAAGEKESVARIAATQRAMRKMI